MSFTMEGFGGHPVAELLSAVNDAAVKVADAEFWSLSDAEAVAALTTVARGIEQLTAIKLRLVADVDGRGLAGRAGAPSMQAWLRHRLNCTPAHAKRDVVLAAALQQLPDTARALAEGRISTAHVRVVAEAVADLPPEERLVTDPVPPSGNVPGDPGDGRPGDGVGARRRAEAHLVAQAEVFDPRELARLGRRIVEVVDPDAADAQEAEQLAELERRAFRRRELRFSPDGYGSVFVTGRLDTESAAVIRRAIDPFAQPRPSADGRPDLRTAAARLADAWTEASRRLLAHVDLPAQRRQPPQIVVTMDYAKLREQVGCGVLDTGEQLSPATVRRIACDAEILPAVLTGGSQVLDLGREERLFTPAQRRALIQRDRGCAFPACDRPPAWCEAHHVKHWIDGGATDLSNGVLLCGFHHRVIHKGHWRVDMAPDGTPEFTPPRYVDPGQEPIRKRTLRPT